MKTLLLMLLLLLLLLLLLECRVASCPWLPERPCSW
jgi:hypothetical protein